MNIYIYNNVFEYKLGDVVLKAVNNVSDLGVNVDCKLNFCEHVANITRKAHARANLILHRIVGIWNNLHLNTCVFNSFKQFKQSLNTDILAPLCRVNFN